MEWDGEIMALNRFTQKIPKIFVRKELLDWKVKENLKGSLSLLVLISKE